MGTQLKCNHDKNLALPEAPHKAPIFKALVVSLAKRWGMNAAQALRFLFSHLLLNSSTSTLRATAVRYSRRR